MERLVDVRLALLADELGDARVRLPDQRVLAHVDVGVRRVDPLPPHAPREARVHHQHDAGHHAVDAERDDKPLVLAGPPVRAQPVDGRRVAIALQRHGLFVGGGYQDTFLVYF
eukprot:scaffold2504_cov89-Isochrysis_galbana.AAC.2